MKTLNFNGRELQYELILQEGDVHDWYSSRFYEGTITTTRKKYLLFGEIITETNPKPIFELMVNIESPHKTKAEIRALISRQLELLDRSGEIERGEII